MEKRPRSQKKKKFILNFNFSDDDSDDDFCQPRVLKSIGVKNNNATPQSDLQKNLTIISSEYSRRQSQLPSFLEDIGLPVMDSTHLFSTESTKDDLHAPSVDTSRKETHKTHTNTGRRISANHNNQKENISPSTKRSEFRKSGLSSSPGGNVNSSQEDRLNIGNVSKKKLQSLDDTPSFIEVEVQDCSVQTSVLLCQNGVSTNLVKDNLSSNRGSESKGNAESFNKSALSGHNSSFLSTCSQKECFTTAIEDSAIKAQHPVLSNSYCSDTTASQEPSSYYVQDASLQVNLSQSPVNAMANNQTTIHPDLKLSEAPVSSNTFQMPDFQTLAINSQNKEKQKFPKACFDLGNDILHEMFDDNSPCLGDKNHVLATDSDEDVSSEKINLQLSKHSAVIADSEDDDCDDSTQGSKESFYVKSDKIRETNNQMEKDTCCSNNENSGFQDSGALCLRWDQSQKDVSKTSIVPESSEIDQVTSSLNALSFHTGHSSSFKKRDSSGSEDDNFEEFLSKLKADQDSRKNVPNENVPSMENFIVDDNDSISSGEESDCSPDNALGDDNDDDTGSNLFYIKTDNKRNKRDEKSRRELREKTYMYYTSSYSDSSHESDSELSDFIVDDEDPKHEIEEKSPNLHHDFSDPEYENDKESPDIRKPASPGNKRRDTKRVNKTSNVLDLDSPKLRTLTPSHVLGKKDKGGVETTPLGRKKKLLASTFMPSWSDSDSDDDFVIKGKTTPSRFQPSSPVLTTFKTPKPVSKSTSQFKTPANAKGPKTHPWTAPRGLKHKPGSNPEEDDSTFFLKSLSADYAEYRRHPEAARYMKNFKSLKEDLTRRLFAVFNETVFDSKIPSTILLEWSARYRKTAGTFSYKRNSPNMAKITLSVKVCDRPERVRDTLAHELCHAAVRIINGVNESHGPVWKSWARKVNAAFPFMPVVARCHDYIINSKYTYQCVNCKYRIGRHSKSLDTEKKVCGHCKGEFQVFLTSELNASSSNSSGAATPKTPRTPNRFAMFVKECYSEVKKRNADFKHGDIMKELSKEFAEKNKINS